MCFFIRRADEMSQEQEVEAKKLILQQRRTVLGVHLEREYCLVERSYLTTLSTRRRTKWMQSFQDYKESAGHGPTL